MASLFFLLKEIGLMLIHRSSGNPGLQINFARAMDILDLTIQLQTTNTVGNRSIAVTVYDSGDTQQSQVTAYSTVGADADMQLIFHEAVVEETEAGKAILTDTGAGPISVPAGGYITVTDVNNTDASDSLTVDLTAE